MDRVTLGLIEDRRDVILTLAQVWSYHLTYLRGAAPYVILEFARLMDIPPPSNNFQP